MAVTIYGGAKLGEFTPLTELLLVESPQQQPCQQALSTIYHMLNNDFIHTTLAHYLQVNNRISSHCT